MCVCVVRVAEWHAVVKRQHARQAIPRSPFSLFHAMTAALCRTYCSFLCQARSCATQASSVFTTCRVSPSLPLPLNGCFSGASDGRPCRESLRRPSTTSSSPSLFSILRRSYQLVARVQPRVCVCLSPAGAVCARVPMRMWLDRSRSRRAYCRVVDATRAATHTTQSHARTRIWLRYAF